MSIIRENILSLKTIVSTSDVIVEVEMLESYVESISIPSEDLNTPCPDFIKKGLTFRIKHILKNTTGHSLPDTIRVPHENWKRSLSQHKQQYANGPSKSFTVNTYKTLVPVMNNAEILFLTSFKDAYNLTAKNSFESIGTIKEIEAYIKAT